MGANHRARMEMRIVFLALLVSVAMCQSQSGQASGNNCRFTLPSSNIYDLTMLKATPSNPHRFYDGPTLYKINFCDAAACSAMGAQPTPGCSQAASATPGTDETGIGSYQGGVQKADINQNDIVDINFKTKGMPTFNMDTKGVKIYYPSRPSPPAGDGQWPGGRRLMQWDANQNQNQPQQGGYPQQGLPGQQGQGMPSTLKTDSNPLTVFVICNPDMTTNAAPVIFAPGMQYRTRTNGHMFVMEHAAGCPVDENFIERAADGIGWGWTFIICFAVLLVVYCGCGIFYKIKKLGVTGIEAIPNVEFWRDYPSLVKDGCSYSVATVMGCFGKGGYSAV